MQHPDIFVVADMSVDQTAGDPATRFQQCMRFYAPLLDLHDALLKHQKLNSTVNSTIASHSTVGGRSTTQRGGSLEKDQGAGGTSPSEDASGGLSTEDEVFLFEQFMFTRHVNGCVGAQRKMINTMGEEAWQAQMAQLGVTEVLWEPHTLDFIRRCLHGLPEDLHVRACGGLMTFFWRGQPLYFVGKWTGLDGAIHPGPLTFML